MNLGKAIVKELDLNKSTDTLGRWMAHYIAEQIDRATTADEVNKEGLEKDCFEAILKLWEHRTFLPGENRPFKNYDSILKVLDKINPDNKSPFYFDSRDLTNDLETTEEVRKWLGIADTLDKTVQITMNYVINQAALCATDERTRTWLENSISISDSDDIPLFLRLLRDMEFDDTEGTQVEKEQERRKYLLLRIKELEAFVDINRVIINSYKRELEEL
ncbi:hypothetical protein KR50_07090 [Jeotgalibacillus campisalis]|uniref:Uncharacterized protein n=2 Tax=Jeotgalibacillus campisalis TaxID=220754 RepID=A0A0C2W443_9BACL|nr:hypothetical protein KR50_07090 [Jeotgalibacillus campisalis]